MRRWLLYGAVLAVLLIGEGDNSRGADVAKLEPVQVLQVQAQAGTVRVATDTGAEGRGRTLAAAAEELEQTTPGVVFLDTAEYLLVNRAAEALLPELMGYLRPSCRVCIYHGDAQLEEIGAYLAVHKPEITLNRYRKEKCTLEKLEEKGGRLYLEDG